ncbi:MAG TPA: hypothetical protein VI320_07925 [Terracidiphilus sp.]|jgi:hypothetical protein
MRVQIYAGLIVKPVKFPDELEVRIFPLSRSDGKALGGSFPMLPMRTWDWMKKMHPISEEQERSLRAGQDINLLEGSIVADFAYGTQFPDDATYEILQ